MSNTNFKGHVKMYNTTYYIDTETGEGLDKILKKIDPLLCKMASKTYIPGYSFDDIKQELSIMAVKGMKSYNPDKQTALSTFLHGHLRNKLISKIKSQNKGANDANIVNDEEESITKIKKVKEELSFSQCSTKYSDGEEVLFENSLDESNAFYSSGRNSYDDMNFKISLNKLTENLDSKTSKIVELVCFNDYTIKDAAEEVGMTGWAASIRIRNLVKKQAVKSMLGKTDI